MPWSSRMTSKPEQKVLETLPKGAEIMNMVRIQMNFYPNPDGPAPLSVLLEGFFLKKIKVSFKLLPGLVNTFCNSLNTFSFNHR